MSVGRAVLVRRTVLIMFVGRALPEGRAVYIMIVSRAVLVSGGRVVLGCRAVPTMRLRRACRVEPIRKTQYAIRYSLHSVRGVAWRGLL